MKTLGEIAPGKVIEDSHHFFVAPRTGIPDDLPIIDLEQAIPGLIVLNPTSHLGNTQSIGLGKIVSFHLLGGLSPFPLDTFRLDRFSEEDVTPALFTQ